MLGVNPPLVHTPRRIVSLVPSLTEVLFAFGLGSRVVGITEYCVEPPSAVRSIPTIGGTKNPDVQKILSLAPDLVVANVEENRQPDVERLQAQGISVFVSFPRTVADALATLHTLAQVTGADRQALPILARLEAAYHDTKSRVARCQPVRVFCPIWKDPWMTINQDTFIHDLLATCGGANIFAARERRYPLAADLGQASPWEPARLVGRDLRYPRLTLEEMAGLMPEVIVLPDEPYRFTAAEQADFEAFPQVPAVGHRRIHVVDGKLVGWYWSRMDEGLRTIHDLLRPGG